MGYLTWKNKNFENLILSGSGYIDVGDGCETKCAGDNHKMLVTVLAILVTNLLYLFTLALGTTKRCHQLRNSKIQALRIFKESNP